VCARVDSHLTECAGRFVCAGGRGRDRYACGLAHVGASTVSHHFPGLTFTEDGSACTVATTKTKGEIILSKVIVGPAKSAAGKPVRECECECERACVRVRLLRVWSPVGTGGARSPQRFCATVPTHPLVLMRLSDTLCHTAALELIALARCVHPFCR
jgi:hypothetical protein